jgi:tetratricopeptide (TPR) repeat protein
LIEEAVVANPPFIRKTALVTLLAFCFAGLGPAQEQKQKQVKDQAEYDLFQAVNKEQDPKKKLQLLDTWKQKYPDSDFKDDRQVIYIQTYQAAGDGEGMFRAAKELLDMDPNHTAALYYLTLLTVSLNNTAPDRLELGEKVANGLRSKLGEMFDPSKKPQNLTDDQWKAERTKVEVEALKTLAFVAAARKELQKAEDLYRQILELTPEDAQVSYQLAANMVAQKDPEKQRKAFYHFARAGYLTGEKALPAQTKKQVQAYFEKIYTNFTGRKDGMKELIEMATTGGPFPPADFTIESEQERMVREMERMREENPQLYLWVQVKQQLIGPDGESYFEDRLKGAGLHKLKGKVVSVNPATRPREIQVALSTDDVPEMTLKLDSPMAGPADPGTEIEFEEAVPQEFRREPFMLTAEIDRSKIEGWPAAARPKPAAKKGAVKKKS